MKCNKLTSTYHVALLTICTEEEEEEEENILNDAITVTNESMSTIPTLTNNFKDSNNQSTTESLCNNDTNFFSKNPTSDINKSSIILTNQFQKKNNQAKKWVW